MRAIVLALGLVWSAQAGEEPSGFDESLRAARAAMRTRDFDAALKHCRAAGQASVEPEVGGPQRATAALLCGDAEMAKERYRRAAKHYRRAAHLAVDEVRIRQNALRRRRRALTKGNDRAAAKVVGELQTHDQRLKVLLRYPRRSKAKAARAAKDLDRIAVAYRADRDRARVDLAKATKALVFVRSGQPEEGIAIAAPLMKAQGSPRVRRVAAQALYYGLAAGEDRAAAVDAAIRYNALVDDEVEEGRRLYRRTSELDRACRRYEDEAGPGACAKRQLEIAKMVWLTDFARQRRRRGPLSTGDLEKVHQQALPWLQQCVLDAARADMERFEGADLRIGWAVAANGRPTQIFVKPSRYEDDLARCLKEVVPTFRYPRVQSEELSTVSVPYRLD